MISVSPPPTQQRGVGVGVQQVNRLQREYYWFVISSTH